MADTPKKRKFLGQDPAILEAVWANLISWFVRKFFPSQLHKLLPHCEQEDHAAGQDGTTAPELRTKCVIIGRPGGVEQLRIITLKPGFATCGYNVPGQNLPFSNKIVDDDDIPPDCVVVENEAFSINYADCCIRWGLYESAKQYVGYPIVPGFDIAGKVSRVGSRVQNFRVGDHVYGCTLFGAYSSRVVVPEIQLKSFSLNKYSAAEAASIPAVSITALYALFLAGHYPSKSLLQNKAILIHSAAGGVGSMLVQMSKLLGLAPVVGVVGSSIKIDAAKSLGCDYVIDKSTEDLWKRAEAICPGGYSVIMDSSGVSTLSESYEHIAATGRLVTFGFHTNLPLGRDMLSPLEWLRMHSKMRKMPRFDAMEMGQKNKAVLAFNLSFLAEEREMLSSLFDEIDTWISEGKLEFPRIVEFPMENIAEAHDLIQSGKTVGKVIIKVKS